MSAPELSIVVPVYNEESGLERFHAELTRVLQSLGQPYEVVYVDDGSTDASLAVLSRLRDADPAVGGVALTRNFGHQVALTAGLELASGRAVVTLDADLQHPPEVIERLVSEWKRGALVVTAVRSETAGSGPLKTLTSRLFYGVINRLSSTPVRPDAADFRLLDRRAVEALRSMRERHRFLRGMVGWLGFPEATVSFKAGRRAAGRSQYTWRKMFRMAGDGIVSFSTAPLRAALWLGLAALGVCGLYAAYVVYMWAFQSVFVIRGWASTVLLNMFLGGCQLILLGVAGEYIGRIYEEVKGRPLYLVRELLPRQNPAAAPRPLD